MKKILTILAATATMFAFGASNGDTAKPTVNHGADFEAEGFVPGANFIWSWNDGYTGPSGEDRYWFTADTDAANIISNYTGSGTGVPIASRPDLFADNANNNYLQVETTGKLYRTVKGNGGSGDFTNSTDYAYSIEDMPIYLDTLVKFTAADSVFGDDALESGDKIAIEYVEHESEGPGDDTVTNFVIRAGYFAQTVIATNYFAAVPADFEKDAWHRLTVRTFASIDAADHVGFVVYLDGTPLEYEDTVLAGDNFSATGAAANFYKEGCHALYPSFVQGGDFQYSISAAAFSGNGSLDDVVFTTTTPNFITAGESVRTEITIGTGIANVAVTVAGTPIAAESTSTSTLKIFNLPAGTTNFVLSVSANEAEGYTFDETTGITLTGATYNPANDTVTITGTSPALTVVGKRDNVTYIDSQGQQQGSTSLATAFANAKSGTTITLAYDITTAINEAGGFVKYIVANKAVTLDLNGKTIYAVDEEGEALFEIQSGATLTVIDSSQNNTGTIQYQSSYGIFYATGTGVCYIGAVTGDNGPNIVGPALAEDPAVWLIRGKFDAANNTVNNAFKWTDYLGDNQTINSTATLSGDYWVVEPQGGSEPTQVAVPTALIGIIYDGTLKTGVVENVGYTLTGNTGTDAGSYEATATLAAGYIWSDNSTTNKTISWGILPNNKAEVVVTLASEIAEYSAQLEFPAASATIGGVTVEGTTNWVENAISEPEAGATNTYTVTFTVTTANYAGSTGTATFKVYKAAGGGSNWPTGWNGGTEPASMVTAFNTWIAAGNDPTAENAEAAFLVGVDVDDYTSDFAAASITIADGKVVITGNYNLSNVNGALAVKMGNAPNALGEPTAVTAVEGAISLTPALGETKKFYKLVIGYPAN